MKIIDLAIIIIIIIIITIILHKKYDYFASLSQNEEAISNIAGLFNTGNATISNMTVTNSLASNGQTVLLGPNNNNWSIQTPNNTKIIEFIPGNGSGGWNYSKFAQLDVNSNNFNVGGLNTNLGGSLNVTGPIAANSINLNSLFTINKGTNSPDSANIVIGDGTGWGINFQNTKGTNVGRVDDQGVLYINKVCLNGSNPPVCLSNPGNSFHVSGAGGNGGNFGLATDGNGNGLAVQKPGGLAWLPGFNGF